MSKEIVPNEDRLRKLEEEFVAETFVTPRAWKSLLMEIEFPKKKKGMTIVDIGAGASEATATLASQGATAIAIDPIYRLPLREIIEKSEEFIKDLLEGPIGKDKWYIGLLKSAQERFARDFKSRRIRRGIYIPALAGNLPFRDESVDFIFSTSCIVFFLDRKWDLLWRSVQESYRVLKPGGEIQISPLGAEILIKTGDPEIDQENRVRRENQDRLIEELKRHGLKSEARLFKFAPSRGLAGIPSGTLKIFK